MKLTLSNLQRMSTKRLQQFIDTLAIDDAALALDAEMAKALQAARHIQEYRAVRLKMYRSWYR